MVQTGTAELVVLPNRLAELRVSRADAHVLSAVLLEKIRYLTWREADITAAQAWDVHRMSRMAYEIAASQGDAVLSNLSSEDLRILWDTPKSSELRFLANAMASEKCDSVRAAGSVDPVVADAVAKSVVDTMTM
jgi:hypothetical protein